MLFCWRECWGKAHSTSQPLAPLPAAFPLQTLAQLYSLTSPSPQSQNNQRSLKPPRTLPGAARALSLLVALDATRNAIALSEAAARGIPTIALASGQVDAAAVTYPVVARDFSPAFVHFFLDLLVRVANVAEPPLPDPLEPEPELAAAAAAGGGHSSSSAAAQQ